MRKYNINANIILVIESLYDKAQIAVLFNDSTRDWFRTTVGVRQGCLLSPALFNIFLERIICEALDDHKGSVSIEGRLITNFRLADDIVVNADEEGETGVLVDRSSRYNRHKVQNGDWSRQDESDDKQPKWLPERDQYKRSETRSSGELAIFSNEGSPPEILSRIAQTTAALSRLKIIWRDNNSSLAFKVNLMRKLILFLFDFTAAGVVQCGGRKTSPRTSTIVQFIFYFGPLRSAIIF